MYEINDTCRALPSLIFNLRRNLNLVKVFNSSPDETAFYHSWFLKMNAELSLCVINPVLYNVKGKEITKLPLDSSCLERAEEGSFLVLDSGFLLVLYYQYRRHGKILLHPSNNDTMMTNKSELLPWKFIDGLLDLRQIVPKIIVTQRNHSQSRFLLSRLNPVAKDLPNLDQLNIDKESSYWFFFKTSSKQSSRILTDDISLEQYYDNLVKQVKSYKV